MLQKVPKSFEGKVSLYFPLELKQEKKLFKRLYNKTDVYPEYKFMFVNNNNSKYNTLSPSMSTGM